jgi:crotonobetainyl-CoA:carnitine CoA-transferase CaiB-like acyl-CoA transferase
MHALEGIRILDLSRYLPGAFATMWLADLGAEVIKIETPGLGDPGRIMGEIDGNGLGPYFATINRGKHSVALNLRVPEDRDRFLQLVATADVLVESYRPGVLAKVELDYPRLAAINPGLIYCAITAYGQAGPRSHLPGHDINFVAESGMLSVGLAQRPPTPFPVQIADIGGGAMPALTAILAALLARARTGRGQFLDVSLMAGTMAWMAYLLPLQTIQPGSPVGMGLLTGSSLCYNVYECADGRYLAIGALEPKFWLRICRRIDRKDLRFQGFNPEPGAAERLAELRAYFRTQPLDYWLDRMGDDVCCTAVRTIRDVLDDPTRAGGLITTEPASGLPQVSFPVHLSDTPADSSRPTPRLGESDGEYGVGSRE